MEQVYAQALWEMVERGMAPKKAVDALAERLAADGRAALMPRIGHAFERLAERARSREDMVLSIAHEKDERAAKSAAKEVLAALGVSAKDLDVHIDSSLIGGWRLEGREQLIDASFKKYLLEMYNRATA